MSDITTDEWLAAVEEAQRQRRTPGAFSTPELADALGVCMETARAKLRIAIAQGRVKLVGREPRLFIDGRTCPIPVYRIVKSERGEE